jgi:hypothetical protein
MTLDHDLLVGEGDGHLLGAGLDPLADLDPADPFALLVDDEALLEELEPLRGGEGRVAVVVGLAAADLAAGEEALVRAWYSLVMSIPERYSCIPCSWVLLRLSK